MKEICDILVIVFSIICLCKHLYSSTYIYITHFVLKIKMPLIRRIYWCGGQEWQTNLTLNCMLWKEEWEKTRN